MPHPPILDLEQIALSLPANGQPVEILKGVSLRLEAAETVGLIGRSGSGKSSLLMIAAGLERPSQGRVRLSGEDITDYSEDQLARFRRKHMGIVFQSFHLIPTLTALENIALPLEIAGLPRKAAVDALEAVGLGARGHHLPAQLSGGEQQRVAVARAIVTRPPLILADEPTGNLDSVSAALVTDLLFELQASSGATLLLVTHAADLAARCQRQITLADGALVSDSAA